MTWSMFTLEVTMNPLHDQRTLVLRLGGREKGRELPASGTPPAPLPHPCSSGHVSPFGCNEDSWVYGVKSLPHSGWVQWRRGRRRKEKIGGEGAEGERERDGRTRKPKASRDRHTVTRKKHYLSGKNNVASYYPLTHSSLTRIESFMEVIKILGSRLKL